MNLNDEVLSDVGAHGRYKVECLTPIPSKLPEFMPLWRERLDVDAKIVALTLEAEAISAKPKHKPNRLLAAVMPWLYHPQARLGEIRRQIADANAELQHLLVRMRPLQYVKFAEEFDNLVTTVGKNDILDKYLKGSAYTQTLVMGLCGTGTKAAADTQASHGGWSEVGGTNAPAYTGNRPTITMGSASGGVSTSPSTSFAITSSGTVAGCFMNNGGSATKDNTTGVLFSAGDFTGGSQAVNNLDTLNVVYTLTVS